MIMCSIMLCSRIQRCLATPQACMTSAGKGKNASKAALVATSRALAACRNSSSSSICASTRSSTGWPTVAPPFSDHAITLGVPGHLVGTENRCPSPPTAFADEKQLSNYLHEWLEAALLQHAHLNTNSCSSSGQQAAAVAANQSVSNPSCNSSTVEGFEWEQIHNSQVASSPEPQHGHPAEPQHGIQQASSGSPSAASVSSNSQSLDELEVPFAGLSDAAVLHHDSSSTSGAQEPTSSSSSADMDVDAASDGQGTVVIVQDAALPLQDEHMSDSSTSRSSRSDDDWSVLSGGSS